MATMSNTLYDEILKQYGKRVAASAVNDPHADTSQTAMFARVKRETNARLAKQMNLNLNRAKRGSTWYRKQIEQQYPSFRNIDDIIANAANDEAQVKSMRDQYKQAAMHQDGMMSTAIQNVVYDPSSKVAYVQFVGGGKQYAYPNVSMNQMRGFMEAGSKGGYYNSVIKRNSVDGFRSTAPTNTGNMYTMTNRSA